MESTLLEGTTTFLEAIAKRIDKDNGAKAIMKRAISGDQRHLLHTYGLLPSLSGVRETQQKLWIFVASLYAYYPTQATHQNFGFSCRKLNDATTSGGTERRFRALLDLSLEDIKTPITALIRQMKSKSILVSYPLLLSDLCQWEHFDQYI
ncbi:MAG: type I-E CRISPR-associated protein Cse2/CasB, partial [Pseudanabaenaceae cyanobacterium bins.68]|nr:type I-E CRISPR-associated protein Cse2/CasB [Pseudanabaenaceae cyanobacterium bins.68]